MSDFAAFQQSLAANLLGGASGAATVHRNSWLRAATDALAANFPVVATLVGQEMFEAVAIDYALARPPRSPVLARYGRGFADWLEEQPFARDLPYLSDVARVERLHIETLFEEDAAPLTRDALAHVRPDDWACLKLRLHPAMRFGWVTTPAMTIWLAHREGCVVTEPVWRAEGALFCRPGSTVIAEMLDAPAHRFLFGLRLGESVGTAAAVTARLYRQADPGRLFASLIDSGVFAAPAPTKG